MALLWICLALFFIILIIASLIGNRPRNKHTNIQRNTDELPSGGNRWLSEDESKALKEKMKRASLRAKKSMSTHLPSEFYSGTLMPKNRIFCPRCGKGDKIHVIYGGDNPRYGCDWCGKIFA
jgi:hypothetical protein